MKVGFFLVLKSDTTHFLHAASLVKETKRVMPGVEVVQLTDDKTPMVPGVDFVERIDSGGRSLLDQRLKLYAGCSGEWLLLDTDVQVRGDVRGVFADSVFDVALVDRDWPHARQGEQMLLTMPFNTGVAFHRSATFWQEVYARWLSFEEKQRGNWMSEQAAVWDIVRTGRFRVKILPGVAYNYPPNSAEDVPPYATLVHYKGDRKKWRSAVAMKVLAGLA